MAYSGETFAMEVLAPALIRTIPGGKWDYAAEHSGGYVALAAHNVTEGSVGRFEAYDRLGGTLLWADDFADLSGWTVGYHGDSWSAAGGRAVIADTYPDEWSNVLVRPMAGASAFVAVDCEIVTVSNPDSWLMIAANKVGTGRTDDQAIGGPGDDGYRVLLRDPGPSLEVVNGMHVLAEWVVGSIGMGGYVVAET